MKVLVDINLSPQWAVLLTAQGISSVHWSTLGPFNTSDDEILAYARANDYVILTKDLDFGTQLASLRQGKPSVVQLRIDVLRPEPLLSRVLGLLKEAADDLEGGALLTIGQSRARLRRLPFE